MLNRASLIAFLGLLTTCSTPAELPEAPRVSLPEDGAGWTLDTAAPALTQQSCPTGTAYTAPLPIDISVTAYPFSPDEEAIKRIPEGVSYVGGWDLNSDSEAFGGLSGLALDKNGDLLAVSDDGAFVWLGLTDGAPDGTGQLAYMLGPEGNQLHGKMLADSEGLSIRDGLAVVSFERSHRVSAFALETCGAAAREARISALPGSVGGRTVDENRGAEALTVTPQGNILFGFETVVNGASPLGAVTGPDEAGWTGDMAPNPAGYAFVGIDMLPGMHGEETYWLFRSYDPIRGNRNVLRWDEGSRELVLSRPTIRDNFEGIAAQDLGNGVTRVWIISDDNFTDVQQTLLVAFDIAAPSE